MKNNEAVIATTNKVVIGMIGILIIISAVTEILTHSGLKQFDNVASITGFISRAAVLILIARQGSLVAFRNPYFWIILVSVIAAIVGALMKVMHWSYGNLILLAGLLPIPIVYAIHFLQKQVKSRLDILKLLWVEFFFITVILILYHFPFKYPLIAIEGLLFLMLFAVFAYRQYHPLQISGSGDL